jgi:peptidoglycan/xylan/chitin deacetylase (PgdA/CDA1 family)
MVSFVSNFKNELKSIYYQSLSSRKVNLDLQKPIISFTFDDVPYSAYKNGVPLLNQYGVKATFYVATGLAEENASATPENRFLTNSEISNLATSGHDVQCHTYSHFNIKSDGDMNDYMDDSTRNILALQRLGIDRVNHFSYPFGHVNFQLKAMLASRYKTLRSTLPGINSDRIDLNMLKAIALYSPQFNYEALTSTIELTRQKRAWLIFYTHGVCENPDNYGCTPKQLEWLLQKIQDLDAHILPVSDAYKLISEN